MKNNAFFLLLLLLSFIAKTSYSQDFWEIVPTPDTANLVSMTINSNGDIFLGSNGVYLSQDNGETWEFKGIYGKTILAIAMDSVGNIFAGSTFKIYKSSDYGETWNVVYYDLTNIISFGPASPGLIFAGGQGPFGVIRSTDYGETWDTVLALFDNEGTKDFATTPDGTVYAGTTDYVEYGGGVYQSSDNGGTWELNGLHYHYIKALAINSYGTLYAGSTGYILGIFEKSQTGHNWTLLQGNVAVAAIIITQNNEIYIGCHYDGGVPGGCLFSSDYGQSWILLNSGLLSNDIDHLCLSPDQYLYAIGSNTLYRSVQPIVSINEINDCANISIYPNPFKADINIHVQPPFFYTESVTIQIYSIEGKLYYYSHVPNKENEYAIKIDSRRWPSGLYYYVIENDQTKISGKLLKFK